MTCSLLGRSGPTDKETQIKNCFPALDEKKKQAVIGMSIYFILAFLALSTFPLLLQTMH